MTARDQAEPDKMEPPRDQEREPDAERVRRESWGRWSEHVAAAWLALHGYRVLARRHRTPYGEIDLIARRGKRIAFVEVKYRRNRAAAEAALRAKQAARVHRAAAHWIARFPAYDHYEQGFDAVFVMPWTRPIIIRDAYQPVGTSGRML